MSTVNQIRPKQISALDFIDDGFDAVINKDWIDLKSLACIVSFVILIMQSDDTGMLKIRYIGLWMSRLKKITQELNAESLHKI